MPVFFTATDNLFYISSSEREINDSRQYQALKKWNFMSSHISAVKSRPTLFFNAIHGRESDPSVTHTCIISQPSDRQVNEYWFAVDPFFNTSLGVSETHDFS